MKAELCAGHRCGGVVAINQNLSRKALHGRVLNAEGHDGDWSSLGALAKLDVRKRKHFPAPVVALNTSTVTATAGGVTPPLPGSPGGVRHG